MKTNETKEEIKKNDKDKVASNKDSEKATSAINDDKSSEPKKSKKLKYSPKIIMRIVIGFIILLVLFVVILGVGMYKYNWNNKVTELVPFPATIVDGSFITYSDFQKDLDTLNFFYAAQVAQGSNLTQQPSPDYLEKTVISRMIREKFLANVAKANNLVVSQSDMDSEFDVLVSQAQSSEEVAKQLKELYNWTPEEFKNKVLYPYLIRSKIIEFLAADDSTNGAIKSSAEDILAKINSGEITFEDAVAEYSEDVTATSGGDLGFFSKGQMVPEFEKAAFALKVGDISDVVQTQYGYHIIKLLERVDATDEKPEQLRAAHILLKTKDVDEWTNDQLAEKSIKIFVSDYEWKSDCGLALAKAETCENNNLLDYAKSASSANSAPVNNENADPVPDTENTPTE